MNLRTLIIVVSASIALAGSSFAKTPSCPCSPCKCAPCTCGAGGSKSGGSKHHDKDHGHGHHDRGGGGGVGIGGTVDLSGIGHRNAEPDPFAAGGGEKPIAHTEEKHPAKHKDHELKTTSFDDIKLTGAESKGDMPPSDTYNVDNRTGGEAVGGPKGVPKGKGKAAAAVCSDCASPALTVTYDSQTNEVKTGPYGATSMGKPPYDLTVEGGCITCGTDSSICCCAITKISVVLHFQINVNTDKIDKGVWMNTTDDPNKLGKTKTTAPKDGDKDKDEWKKVDKDSVVTHEKTHCEDLRKKIEDNLKDGLKGNAFTPSPCPDKDCKKDNDACKKILDNAKAAIDTRMDANIKEVVKKLTAMEKEGYPGGDMEQNARKAQAKDLNERNKEK